MNSDIYERHKIAVFEWQRACQAVEAAEYNREAARAILDKASDELLSACQDPNKSVKPVNKRGRRRGSEKANGLDIKAMMREPESKAV